MYKCPHCNKPGISVWRKLWIGSAIPATCKQCGKKVGVPYATTFAMIPFIFAIVLTGSVGPAMLRIATWVVGFLIMGVIQLKWVPLVPR